MIFDLFYKGNVKLLHVCEIVITMHYNKKKITEFTVFF